MDVSAQPLFQDIIPNRNLSVEPEIEDLPTPAIEDLPTPEINRDTTSRSKRQKTHLPQPEELDF